MPKPRVSRLSVVTSGSLLFLLLCPWFHAALLPPSFVDCVVAIGRIETQQGPQQGKWVPEASGFLYGDFVAKRNDTQNEYRLYLVTNRHVIAEHAAMGNGPLMLRFNLKSTAREYPALLNDAQGKPTWHAHPNPLVDLAVISINAQFLKDQGARFDFFTSDKDFLSRDKAKEIGLSEGDGVFVLGFPMGIVDGEQDYVIVRQGIIARIKNALDSHTVTSFLIDSFIFPGNSGGPVVLKPELFSIEGTKAGIKQAYLLGVIKDFRPYVDVAISAQTRRPRVTFEENSGLADVIPADYIQETIDDFKRSTPGQVR